MLVEILSKNVATLERQIVALEREEDYLCASRIGSKIREHQHAVKVLRQMIQVIQTAEHLKLTD